MEPREFLGDLANTAADPGAVAAPLPGQGAAAADGVRLPGRLVPLPQSVSPEARRFLAGLIGPDGGPCVRTQIFPPTDDLSAWKALKASMNQAVDEMAAAEGAGLRSACETVTMAGAVVQLATPHGGSRDPALAYLDVHGGALICGDGEFCRTAARRAADNLGVLAYGVDYRMPPEHPYPAGLDDCVAVYRELLKRYEPRNIIVGGLSAGGNLAAATVLRARDEGLPPPAAVVLLTPEVDLTESGDSFATVEGLDISYPVTLMPANRLYAAGHDLTHPYLSPLFADFSRGFPPTFLQAGTRDFFLSNTVRMHRALRRAGVPAELHVFEAMPHGGFHGAPEDTELAAEVRRFADEHWSRTA